jgi:hypothetical protein
MRLSILNILKLEHEKMREKITETLKEKKFENQKKFFLEIKKDLKLQLTIEKILFFREIQKYQNLQIKEICDDVEDIIAELSSKLSPYQQNDLLNDLSEAYQEYSASLEKGMTEIPLQKMEILLKKFKKLKQSKWRLFFHKMLKFFY